MTESLKPPVSGEFDGSLKPPVQAGEVEDNVDASAEDSGDGSLKPPVSGDE